MFLLAIKPDAFQPSTRKSQTASLPPSGFCGSKQIVQANLERIRLTPGNKTHAFDGGPNRCEGIYEQ
jgi:hypothetical protein